MKQQNEVGQEKTLTEALYEISRGLNTARDVNELLQTLALPALEAGAFRASLMYIDLDEAGEPEWAEVVAAWQREGAPTPPVGTRYRLSEFPISQVVLASQDEPQLIADVTADERVDEGARNMLAQIGARAMAVIPVSRAGRWVGLIIIFWDKPRQFKEQEREIYHALVGLASPAVENRRLLENLENVIAERTREVATFKALVENSTEAIGMADLQGRSVYGNRAFYELLGYDYEAAEIVGLPITAYALEEDMALIIEHVVPRIMRGEGWSGQVRPKRKDGTVFDAWFTIFPLRDERGNPTGIAVIIRDLTEQKRLEEERARMQQEIIEAQRNIILELSSPVVPITAEIIAMPLVGSIDSSRAQRIMEDLLEAIGHYGAEVVIIDITGVPLVDTGVANHLVQVTRAARLLGSHCVLVGISPEVAQTVVSLGVDLSNIATRANLQSGIEYALQRAGRKIVSI